MNIRTTKSTIAECFYCEHVIDLVEEPAVEVETLESLYKGADKAKAHPLCDAEASQQSHRDRAMMDYIDDLDYELPEEY